MKLIMLGAPGAGKGTQAAKLSEKLNIPHISTGDIFRNNIKNGTELGKKAKEYIDKGMLVPDELTISIVKDRLMQEDCKNGFILDGFPRTIPQAEYLQKALNEMGTDIDHVVNIDVDDGEIIKRMSGRRVCPNCGATFHTVFKPTKTEGTCDLCQAKVIQREDDKEETVISRLKTYHEQTEPLIDFYSKKGKILTVAGRKEIEETSKAVLEVLGV
ncbi:MAG: adenylate kinase [Bacillota bacterium]|nr:adenylate kinase [Bacillota bacterium]